MRDGNISEILGWFKIERVMRKLNTKPFANYFTIWIQAVSKATGGNVIAIDEKI